MNQFDEIFDFVVVGSGGAAMCAALYMASCGKSVVLLEKTDLVGGSTARSGGVMWIPNNPFLKRDGIDDSFEKAGQYLEGLATEQDDTPASTAERRRAYLREAPNMIAFLREQSIPLDRVSYWPDYYDERPGGLKEGRCVVADIFNLNELGEWKHKLRPGFLPAPARLEEALIFPLVKVSWRAKATLLKVACRVIAALLTGKRYVSAGAALQGHLLKGLLAQEGVDIRIESPVSDLMVEDGVVTGVMTLRHGQPWRVGGRLGVMVGAGGFARNQAMRDKYQPGTSTQWSSTAPGDTGEMIATMMRHGAAIAQMEEMVGNQCTLPPGTDPSDIKQTAQGMTAKPHAILVDQTGVRYMSEGGSYMAYCKGMFERNLTVPAVPSWAVFDSQYIKKYMLAGTMPGRKKPRRWYDEGYLKKAETIEALAQQIGVDSDVLNKTIERFNGFVTKNRDEDFGRGDRAYDRWLGDFTHRPSQTLGALTAAPFYAVPVYPGDVSTFGGVVTDVHARVLREDGSVIPGLYAAGVASASVMGRVYPGAGSSIGPALTFGYLAARHAANTVVNEPAIDPAID